MVMSKSLVNKISAKSDKKVVFRIEKDFSLNTVEQLKIELEEILSKTPSFDLELKNIDCFDLSAVQLLTALKAKMKDKLTIKVELKDDIKLIMQHAGIDF